MPSYQKILDQAVPYGAPPTLPSDTNLFLIPEMAKDLEAPNLDALKMMVENIETAYGTYDHVQVSLRHGKDHWRAMSVLQKAIRRVQDLEAVRPVTALLEAGPAMTKTLWRRLTVIALEDIGYGGLDAAAFTTMCATKEARAHFGDRRLAIAATLALSHACKSRDLCDVVVWEHFGEPGCPHGKVTPVAERNSLIATMTNEDLPINIRQIAASYLWGKTFDLKNPVLPKRSPDDRFAFYKNLEGLPEMAVYASEFSMKAGGDCLGVGLALPWWLMCASNSFGEMPDYYDGENVDIRGVPASTYDKHTQIGKIILKRIMAENAPLRDWLKAHPKVDAMEAVGRALFYVEGAVLKPRWWYEHFDSLFFEILDIKLKANGLSGLVGEGDELLQLVKDALPQINAMREAISR